MSSVHSMDASASPLEEISIPKELVSLKTTLELRPGDALVEVYITKVPLKQAHNVLGTTRSLYADPSTPELQHLRRFSKAAALPHHVMNAFGITPPKKAGDAPYVPERGPGGSAALYLLVGPTNGLTPHQLALHLETVAPECGPSRAMISKQVVPLLAPTSAEQAAAWTKDYWPCIYKKSNPFGPHPSIVERATAEIAPNVTEWMERAAMIGETAKATGIGEPIGAIVVDRSSGAPKVVALAADARWKDHGKRCAHDGAGNIMAHATLRAIGIVAQKMKASGSKYENRRDPIRDAYERTVFGDTPLLPAEKLVYDDDNISQEGYLCHGLEMYLTHEPCIMCSMAILHSRFAKVVIGQRMPKTGGMSSETEEVGGDGLGYGLFWRKELNWSLLAWEFKQEHLSAGTILQKSTQV